MKINLNITNLRYDQLEIGNLIKASKAIYTWDFVLDGNTQKVELQHSRITGKRVVLHNGHQIANGMQYTYNYNFSFTIDKHFMTLIQISPDQYDLRIDNISFLTLLNRQKIQEFSEFKKENDQNKNKKKNKTKRDDDNFFASDENDFNFGEKISNDKENKDVIRNDNNNNNENVFDFGFDDNVKTKETNNNNQESQSNSNNNNNLLDFGDGNFSGNNNVQNNNNVNNNLMDIFGGNSNSNNTQVQQQNNNNNVFDFNFNV